jgi:solute carrier family 39 (zinc transporter), member 1/2/3
VCSRSDGLRSEGEVEVISSEEEREDVEDKAATSQSTGREKEVAFILVTALSLHGFFEGLSIGTAGSDGVLWKTFAAIAAHKLFEAFSLGIRLEMWRELGNNAIKHFFIVLFCSVTLVGGLVGIALQSVLDDGSASVIEGVALSLAAGSFLYVSLVEVLPEALKRDFVAQKFAAVLVGVAIFAILVAILP